MDDKRVRELIERLRGKATGQNVGISTHLFDQAADAIADLRARLAEAERIIEGIQVSRRDLYRDVERLIAENKELHQLLSVMRPYWESYTDRRIWDAATAGLMASIRLRLIEATQEGKP